MGVIPQVVQSDNEFCTMAFEELFQSLGSSQIFSTALHPQSQGIVERSHREMRESLAKLIESYARANPRRWPQYVRWLEHKLRHKPLIDGVTQYQVIHGFLGSSELSTALQAMAEIPLQLLTQDWLQGIISESRELEATLSEHWTAQAESQMKQHEEKTNQPSYVEGDVVLVSKPLYERGTGAILPQSDGPYIIARLPTPHTAILEDIYSGDLYQHGKPVAVVRLIRYAYPVDWVREHDVIEDTNQPLTIEPRRSCCSGTPYPTKQTDLRGEGPQRHTRPGHG